MLHQQGKRPPGTERTTNIEHGASSKRTLPLCLTDLRPALVARRTTQTPPTPTPPKLLCSAIIVIYFSLSRAIYYTLPREKFPFCSFSLRVFICLQHIIIMFAFMFRLNIGPTWAPQTLLIYDTPRGNVLSRITTDGPRLRQYTAVAAATAARPFTVAAAAAAQLPN